MSHRIHAMRRLRTIAINGPVVCQSVCPSVARAACAKTAEWIDVGDSIVLDKVLSPYSDGRGSMRSSPNYIGHALVNC